MDYSGDMADKIGTGECGEILIYQTDDGQTNIEVKIEDDTVWLTQQQLTELYQCSKSNISEHIKHIFEEGELDKDAVVRKFRTTADDGKTYNVTYYNLDMIISLGYRIKSMIATRFRHFARYMSFTPTGKQGKKKQIMNGIEVSVVLHLV